MNAKGSRNAAPFFVRFWDKLTHERIAVVAWGI